MERLRRRSRRAWQATCRLPDDGETSVLKRFGKLALRSVGVDPVRLSVAARNTRLAKAFAERRADRLLTDAETRDAFVRKIVDDFNPGLRASMEPGVVRIATIWEGNGRFRWLDHANDDPRCQLIHVPRAVFNPAWQFLLRDYLEIAKGELRLGEYALDRYFQPRYQEGRRRFEAYCAAVAALLQRHYGVDVFLMPKLNDDWTLDLITALRKLDIRLVVDDREGTITRKRMETVPPRLRELLDVHFELMTVHNSLHRDLFVASGLDPDRIVVNGAPQSDYWHRPDLWQSRSQIDPRLRDDRILVLYFSFGPQTYLNFYYGDEPRDWSPLCTDYHDVIARILERYGDRVQLVYKFGGKPLRDLFVDYTDFKRRIAPYAAKNIIVETNVAHSAFDLIANADIVVGFQTSGMIEAMFRDKPIVHGAWGGLFDDIKDTLLPLHRTPALTFADSKEALWDALASLIDDPGGFALTDEIAAARKSFRETYFHQPDGRVSARLLDYCKGIAKGVEAPGEMGRPHIGPPR